MPKTKSRKFVEVKGYKRLKKGFGDTKPRKVVVTSGHRAAKPKNAKVIIPRTPTGIPGFDKLVEGGLARGSINLIAGDSGIGKSIFGMEFLVNGIQKFNEPGVYMSFEERKEDVYLMMLRMGWDLQELENKGKFAFIEYTPEQVNKVIEAGGGIVSDIVRGIEARRIVIDSITAFTLLYQNKVKQREALLALFKMIRKWQCTAVLISETTQDMERHKVTLEEYEVDGSLKLYNVLNKRMREKYIEVFKMRGTKHSHHIFRLIINEKGIQIKR